MNERALRVLEYNKIIAIAAQFAQSDNGRAELKKLIPSGDYEEVASMQRNTAEALVYLYGLGYNPIQPFMDISPIIAKARVLSVLTMKELLDFGQFLRAARAIRAKVARHEDEESGVLSQMAQRIVINKALEDEIERCILSADEMADDASPLLKSIRVKQRGLADKIKEKLNSFIRSPDYQKYIQDPIVTMRFDRYVLPVKQECRQFIPGLIHDQSASGATLFIEPMAVVEINNDARQLKVEEKIEMERILSELTAAIQEKCEAYMTNLGIMVQLDVIFAKARFGQSLNGVTPKLNNRRYINLKQARHPLLAKEKVVPIDVYLGDEFTTLVITGPNTGGKTVTLKTIGLFTLMAQAGLCVPAGEGTQIAVFKQVYADIGDEQSVEQSLSTFSSHMTNIASIVSQADIDSLVLFDELCAGTDPVEGAALAMAILDKLRAAQIRTVANTHYSELKAYSLSAPKVENASVEFDVETLSPTYRLSIGVPGKSNAFEISRHLGLDEGIIEHAGQYLSEQSIKFEEVLMNAEYHKQIAEKERALAEDMRKEIALMQSRIAAQERALKESVAKTEQKAKENARAILDEARRDAERLIGEMKDILKRHEQGGDIEDMRKLKKELDEKSDKLSPVIIGSGDGLEKLQNVSIGQNVYVSGIDKNAVVSSLPNSKGELLVTVGAMSVKANIKDLYKPVKDKKSKKEIQKGKELNSFKAVSLSIDVRGQNVEEACMNIDKYIDDVFLTGLNEISIIHGKGTGALRAGIQAYLRNHPRVRTFRLGVYGEGEAGVTIVELK